MGMAKIKKPQLSDFERYTELFDTSMRIHLEKYYKKSFRDGWVIVDVVKLNNSDKWLIKWAKVL